MKMPGKCELRAIARLLLMADDGASSSSENKRHGMSETLTRVR